MELGPFNLKKNSSRLQPVKEVLPIDENSSAIIRNFLTIVSDFKQKDQFIMIPNNDYLSLGLYSNAVLRLLLNEDKFLFTSFCGSNNS